MSLNDTHVSAPFFGPNIWEGVLTPTAGGGIPPHHHFVPIKLTFKEGGAFDFSNVFERIKETLVQAAEIARENGTAVQPGELDLEQLPAYEETVGGGVRVPQQSTASEPMTARPAPVTAQGYPDEKSASTAATTSNPRPGRAAGVAAPDPNLQRPVPLSPHETPTERPRPPPNEAPPGYEEVNEDSEADKLDRLVREG